MQNSNSIKTVVDVSLFSRLVTMFHYYHNDAEWLISASYEDKEKWGTLGVCELAELMKSCADKKELHAIALFCWLYDFNNAKFISRLIGELTNETDVIFEAAVYNSMYCKDGSDLWVTMNDSLRHARRETALEYLIAEYALGDEAAGETKSCLCKLVSAKMDNLSVEEELPLFVRCAQLAQELGEESDIFMRAVLKSVTKVPVERGSDYAAMLSWGYDYVEQLKLSWCMQKNFYSGKRLLASPAKEKKLEDNLLAELAKLKRPWTVLEQEIINSIHINGRYLVRHEANVNNRMGISLVIPIELDDASELDLSKILLISVNGYSNEGIKSVWKINHTLFVKALDGNGMKSYDLFCSLKEAGCEGLEVYTDYLEKYICDWQSVESWNWVKEHGFSKVSSDSVTKTDYPFIKGRKEKSLFRSMLKEYLEVWDPEKYKTLFKESPDRFKIMQRWFSEEEIEEGMQYLPERVGLYTALAIFRQHKIADMITDLCSDWAEEIESIFSELKDAEIKIIPTKDFQEILDLDASVYTKAMFLKKGIDASVVDKIPPFFLRREIVVESPWVLEVNWSDDIAINHYEWNRLTDEQKVLVAEFRGIVPVKYFENLDELRELYKKFSDRFEDIFSLVKSGVPISELLKLDSRADVFFELFGEFNYLVENGMSAPFLMWAKEHIPDKLKKMTKKHYRNDALLFNRNFYLNCNFDDIDLEDATVCTGNIRAGMTFDKSVLDMILNSSIDIAWMVQVIGLPSKEFALLSEHEGEIYNFEVLSFNLLQQNFSAWSKKLGVKGRNLIRVLSYNYRWDESTIPLADYIINNEVIGRIDKSVKFVLRKNYDLRYILSEEEADLKLICVDRLIEVYSAEFFEPFISGLQYGSDLLTKMGRRALIKFLCNEWKEPEAGIDFMEGLDKRIRKFLTGRISPLRALDWMHKLEELVVDNDVPLSAIWLNLIDGTWFEFENSLYRILKDSKGYGVQCCLGEDILDSKIRRIKPTEVCITSTPCPIVIDDSIKMIYA